VDRWVVKVREMESRREGEEKESYERWTCCVRMPLQDRQRYGAIGGQHWSKLREIRETLFNGQAGDEG
jgi:hypothetical protein